MAIDTTTPRSRRALLMGALGALGASAATFARPPITRAGVDGDVVLDAVSTASGTTEIDGDGTAAVLEVVNGSGIGLIGSSAVDAADIPPAIKASTGVYGISLAGVGVYGASDTGHGIYAANNSTTKAAIAAEGDPGTAIHGHAGSGPIPTFPVTSAILATADGSRHGIQTYVVNGFALQALSTGSVAILASGDEEGIAAASSGDGTGVVGWSTNQTPPAVAPAGPAKTGVYGEATQDANARGVFGKSTLGQGLRGEATTGTGARGEATSGEGVHGEATSGVGVKAVALSGAALDVAGRAVFSRSGIARLPKNATLIDVIVPGGLAGSPMAFAALQIRRGNIHVLAARPNYPSAGKVRIYLSGIASTTASTPIAWWVLG